MGIKEYLVNGASLLTDVAEGGLEECLQQVVDTLVSALAKHRCVLVCGNGGSAADAMHIAGELVGRFLVNRPPYKVVALGTDPAITTAWSNDFEFETIFSRQVEGLGEAGGVVWALSTSGNSENIIRALSAAKAKGMKTVAFTGRGGGRAAMADMLVSVPSDSTPRIQEIHTFLYHYVCGEVERRLSKTSA
ncbi:MAG: SIS domain-containing protein [Pseudomonadota bacterium]|nr:SIS domain-containing protein [Pseudomonadota bacterium]